MQYWSDGSHTSGTLAIGSIVAPASATQGDLWDVQTGLGDNATRQSLPTYIQGRVALCAESTPGTCALTPSITVVGFTRGFFLAPASGPPAEPPLSLPSGPGLPLKLCPHPVRDRTRA